MPVFYLLEGLVDQKSPERTFQGGERNHGLLEKPFMWRCICRVMKFEVQTLRLPSGSLNGGHGGGKLKARHKRLRTSWW